jgi:hypothetical protein
MNIFEKVMGRKKREPIDKPTVGNGTGRQNGDQSGYNDKGNVTDYTISDEYIAELSPELVGAVNKKRALGDLKKGTPPVPHKTEAGYHTLKRAVDKAAGVKKPGPYQLPKVTEGVNAATSAGGKQVTQKAPVGSIARNAPASARALQTAANARVSNKEVNADKQKDTQHSDMQKEIQKRQQASKKTLEKDMSTISKEEIDHVNSVFAKNLEEGYLRLDEKKWIANAIKKPGAMTAAAKREGVSNSEYEKEHMHDSGKAGKRARLAMTLKKMHEEKTDKADGAKLGRPSTQDDHPIAQARKVISMRGQHKFTHKSGEKHMMDPKVAHQILHKHDNMKTSAEKDEFAHRVHHSKKSMEDALAGKPAEKKPKVSLAGKITGTQK